MYWYIFRYFKWLTGLNRILPIRASTFFMPIDIISLEDKMQFLLYELLIFCCRSILKTIWGTKWVFIKCCSLFRVVSQIIYFLSNIFALNTISWATHFSLNSIILLDECRYVFSVLGNLLSSNFLNQILYLQYL